MIIKNMKNLLFILAMLIGIAAYAQNPESKSCASADCRNQCDSLNIPVYIVDGVEVQDLSGLASDDVVEFKVIKDPEITKIFSPRLGGVVMITTKSKKFLTPILEDFNRLSEEQRQQRIPGELRIR